MLFCMASHAIARTKGVVTIINFPACTTGEEYYLQASIEESTKATNFAVTLSDE